MTPRDPKSRTHWVWRISSVLLLTLWTMLAAAPFAQAETDLSAPLPACCRTHGAHHCTGANGQSNDAPTFAPESIHEKCPCTPAAGSSVLLGASSPGQAASFDAPPAIFATTCSTNSTSDEQDGDGANPKRGPPTSSHLR